MYSDSSSAWGEKFFEFAGQHFYISVIYIFQVYVLSGCISNTTQEVVEVINLDTDTIETVKTPG